MDLLKKMFDFDIKDENEESSTQNIQRELEEIAILQDYIDKYDLNFFIIHIYRTLIFNGFSAKEAINTVDESREYTFEEISAFDEFQKKYSIENEFDYIKYKEAVINHFSRL